MRRTNIAWTLLAALGFVLAAGCEEKPYGEPRAYVVTDRAQLIGGSRAHGTIGDVVLENGKVRVLINAHASDASVNRYGGALIDADVARFEEGFDPAKGGRDQLMQIVPLLDVKTFGIATLPGSGPVMTVDPAAVEIASDGKDGGDAVVRVRGTLRGIVGLLDLIPVPFNRLPVEAVTEYRLGNGDSYVRMTTSFTVLNEDGSDPADVIDMPLRPVEDGRDPLFDILRSEAVGDAVFFAASLSMLGPDTFGFAPDWYAEDLMARGESTLTSPPTMPFIAALGEDVGYALVSEGGPISFPIMESFLTIGFQGVSERGTALPDPGMRFTFTRYLVIADGDAAGLLDQVIRLRGWASGHVAGRVVSAADGRAVSTAKVLVFRHPRYADGTLVPLDSDYEKAAAFLATLERGAADPPALAAYSRFAADARRFDEAKDASFAGDLPVREETGDEEYLLLAVGPGNVRSRLFPLHLANGETREVGFVLPATGTVAFEVRSAAQDGPHEPCKVTFVGTSGEGRPEPRLDQGFLPAGEAQIVLTPNGRGSVELPEGTYRVIASRGPEYTIDEQEVDVAPRETRRVVLGIDRVVDTGGWLASDFHMHTDYSPDAGTPIEKRLRSAMAEGLDVIAATDHDVITNYRPELEKLGGLDRLVVMAGDELSDINFAHFGGWPLQYDQTEVAGGAPDWRLPSPTATLEDGSAIPSWTAQDCFDALHARTDEIDQPAVVNVHHSQESMTGYLRSFGFEQYSGTFGRPDFLTIGNPAVNGDKLLAKDGSALFSWDFDTIELLNGKRFEDFRTATEEEIGETHLNQPAPPDSPLLPILIRTADEQQRIESGELLLDHTNRGMIDDWFTLLVMGKRPGGLGDSDSHSTAKEETGKIRTYVMASTDEPRFLGLDELVTNVKRGRAVATTGPFLELWVNGAPIGSDVSAPDSLVSVRVRAQAPPWMALDRIEIYGNGRLVGEIGADSSDTWLGCETSGLALSGPEKVTRLDATFPCYLDGDTVFAAIAIGYQGMSPVSNPVDGPAVELADSLILAVNTMISTWLHVDNLIALGGTLERRHVIYPYAVTNAIWVDVDGADADGDGHAYDGPGSIPGWFDEDDVPTDLTDLLDHDDGQAALYAAKTRWLSLVFGIDE